jgi:oligoribonuclease NrnB/cAMP/cGMP phosphodiesterase (DHH superfamily)
MVNFCLPMDSMVRLSQLSDFIWIDHHKSSIEAAEQIAFGPRGLRKIGQATCELTWQFLFPTVELPHAVYLLGRCDVWDLEVHSDILPFQFGMARS